MSANSNIDWDSPALKIYKLADTKAIKVMHDIQSVQASRLHINQLKTGWTNMTKVKMTRFLSSGFNPSVLKNTGNNLLSLKLLSAKFP